MRARKENILNYLKEIKSELQGDGISSLALFGSFTYADAELIRFLDNKKYRILKVVTKLRVY